MTSRADQVPITAASTSGFSWRRLIFWFGLVLLAVALFWAAFAFGYSRMHEKTIMPGVSVAGVDLSGLERTAAETKLREELPDLSGGNLTVNVGGETEQIPYSGIGRDYDLKYMLDQAYGLGRRGTVFDQVKDQIGLLQSGANVEPVMTFDSSALATRVAALAESAQVQVVDAQVTHQDGVFGSTTASDGLAIDVPAVVSQAVAAVNNLSPADTQVDVPGTTITPAVSTEAAKAAADQAESVVSQELTVTGQELSATIDPATLRGWVHLDPAGVGQWNVVVEDGPISQYMASYALENDVPAKNATFSLGGGGNINVVPSVEGRAIDVEPSSANVFAALQARVNGQPTDTAAFSFVPVEPTLTTNQARSIAPRVKKLGEWTTFYHPDPALNGNGVNIQIPTRILDGQVVEPNASFDFLSAIGPITSPPYEAGGALVHGQIKEDSIIGGGMCSVSTTLFNAALRYGLPIWARDNHSLYISRYPVGLDATVWSTGAKNRQTMGFVNDTGYPLVIRGINTPGAVTFQIWGVNDGRTVHLSDPVVENTVKPTYMLVEYTNDLAPGRRSVFNDAYNSFDASVTRTVRDRNGNVTTEETYKSHYKQLPKYVRVGRTDGDPHTGKVVKVPVATN